MHTQGELFTWILDLFGVWESDSDREELWITKRALLQAVNYTLLSGDAITVQRGWWFSSHEQWKLSMMPYLVSTLSFARKVLL